MCCQQSTGGLKDKPTKGPDYYHTAYSLAGCSIMQHKSDYENLYGPNANTENFNGNYKNDEEDFEKTSLLNGLLNNKLRRIHPIYNVRYDLLSKARNYFRNKKKI